MARLSLAMRKLMRKRKLVTVLYLLKIFHILNWFFQSLFKIVEAHVRNYSLKARYYNSFYKRRETMYRLVYESDVTCIEQLRMNRQAFNKLCYKLQTIGQLKDTKNMLIDEQVAIFLHIIAHHVKNRVTKFRFMRSGETISRHFNVALNAVIRLEGELLKKPDPVLVNSMDERWKWFKVFHIHLVEVYFNII
uniref:DUF8040 domain-containing protein n=1 Tax=Davidia involucrata TaxID=16924 RepID=A0A5B7AZZ1_DAVIN